MTCLLYFHVCILQLLFCSFCVALVSIWNAARLGLWIRCSPFICSKPIFIKLIHIKIKVYFFLSILIFMSWHIPNAWTYAPSHTYVLAKNEGDMQLSHICVFYMPMNGHFGELLIVFSTKVLLLFLLYLMIHRCYLLHQIRIFTEIFS